jgi:hypothetical protein
MVSGVERTPTVLATTHVSAPRSSASEEIIIAAKATGEIDEKAVFLLVESN